MTSIKLPNTDVSVTLTEKFDNSNVSRFLDDVISSKISVQQAREDMDDILAELGIEISADDLNKLKESDLVKAQYAQGQVPEAGPGVVAAVFVVVACADGSVH